LDEIPPHRFKTQDEPRLKLKVAQKDKPAAIGFNKEIGAHETLVARPEARSAGESEGGLHSLVTEDISISVHKATKGRSVAKRERAP